ncbi:MAG: hypothetical protein V3574_03555 [Candidatus Moraniibacteriota bacterium]
MNFGSFKVPKNDSKYYWTRHCIGKMMQYGLSPQRVKRVIRSCERVEEGVAKNTVAVMQPNSIKFDKSGKKKWSQEIWVMYQTPKASISKLQFPVSKEIQNFNPSVATDRLKIELAGKNQLKIISVWRYPGVSPKNNPIPSEILEEVGDMI